MLVVGSRDQAHDTEKLHVILFGEGNIEPDKVRKTKVNGYLHCCWMHKRMCLCVLCQQALGYQAIQTLQHIMIMICQM